MARLGLRSFDWVVMSVAALALSACSDPCTDDGFGGGDQSNCASLPGADGGGSQGSGGASGTASGGASLDDGPTLGGGGGTGDSGAGTDSETDSLDSSGTSGLVEYCPDIDMDGFPNLAQCVDADPDDPPAGHIPATEDGDCDDTNPNTHPGAAEFELPEACTNDDDEDGWGDDSPPPGVDAGTDCDDTDNDTFPGAAENESLTLCMDDDDEDGYGDPDPPGGVEPGVDCDDSDENLGPCIVWCMDSDGDGFGDPNNGMEGDPKIAPTPDHVMDCTDCDDNASFTFPGAAQSEQPPLDTECLKDEDDDGFGDEDPPAGVTQGTDCDDLDPLLLPGIAELEPEICTIDEDDDGWGDWNASAVNPQAEEGSDCDDSSPGVGRCALLVTQDGTANAPIDAAMLPMLQALDLDVILAEDLTVTAVDADPAALVVISGSATSFQVGNIFRNVNEGVVVLEGQIWDDMNMSPTGNPASDVDVQILDDSHEIAGGLAGIVDFMLADPGSGIFHTSPNANADIIAARVGNPNEVVVFGFHDGATMEAGFSAPGRRVGFGADIDGGMGTNGQLGTEGLIMFQAAAAWAME